MNKRPSRTQTLRKAFIATVTTASAIAAVGCFGVTSNPPPLASCPAEEPSGGVTCGDESAGLSCSYDDGCGSDIGYTCDDSQWEVTSSVSCNPPPPLAECPINPPDIGEPCQEQPATIDLYPASCMLEVPTPCGFQVAELGCEYSELTQGYAWALITAPACEAQPEECQGYTDSGLCDGDTGCSWRARGCADGTATPEVETGCYPSEDCTIAGCGDWGTCTAVIFDPCIGSFCQACYAEANVCIPS